MEKFSDFYKGTILDGKKIRIAEVFDKEITVLAYRLAKSKQKEGTNYVTIQIEYNGERRVIFTGSDVLAKQLTESEGHFPFQTVIRKMPTYYTFS